MSEEAPLPETKHTDHKSWSRHRWREKLSRSEGKAFKNNEFRDQDLQDFLRGPASTNAAPALPTLQLPSQANPLGEATKGLETPESKIKRKQPRTPGLHVSFTAAAPTIIGEGGDEATLPAMQVLSYLRPSTDLPSDASANVHPQHFSTVSPPSEIGEQSFENSSTRPRPTPLERRSTGLHASDEIEHDSESAKWQQQQLSEPTSSSFPPQVKNIAKNGNYVGGLLDEGDSSLTDQELVNNLKQDDSVRQNPVSLRGERSLRSKPRFLNPATSFANSLTPSPSPHVSDGQPVPSDEGYPFPSAPPDVTPRTTSTDAQSLEQVKQQRRPQVSPKLSNENRGLSLRDIAKTLGDDALNEFASRVQPFGNIFLLGLDSRTEPTLQQWVMAASWWFLKGRTALESAVRSKARNAAVDEHNASDMPLDLKQSYIHLAKAWWIVSEMTPKKYPEVQKLGNKGLISVSSIIHSFVDAETTELIQIHFSIISNLRALTMSMRKNRRMPPFGFELQGLDTRIFLTYPLLSSSTARLLSAAKLGAATGKGHAEPASFFPFPITDTERHFNYGRMFVDVILDQAKTESQVSMPCLLSIIRERRDRQITMVIASQDRQVHLVVEPDSNGVLSWQDVCWEIQQQCIQIKLCAGSSIHIRFAGGDFKTLWGIHDHIRTVQKASQGGKTEILVYEEVLRSFQWFEPGSVTAQFPAGPVKSCTLRLFECFKIINEGNGERQVHNGYRLVVVTPQKVKKLNYVSLNPGKRTPIVFSYLRDESGAPAMLLKTSKSSRDPYMVMSFQEATKRDLMYSLLSGTKISGEEQSSKTLSLERLELLVGPGPEKPITNREGNISSFNPRGLNIIHRPSHERQLGGRQTRVWVDCDTGCIIDRINPGPGELQIGMDVDNMNRILISRLPQTDLTLCFADNTLSKEEYEGLQQMLDYIRKSTSTRLFSFRSLSDLHTFQGLITGFTVLFDSFAKTFAIARKRMVVPIHKHWEASVTRLQIVRHEQTIQLLVFFKDFRHGSCMNFVLKSTDVFESFSRSGISYVCFVDAKFALPKSQADSNHDYVCLDLPEYPGEHDDITIGFETEHGKHMSCDPLALGTLTA
ncbi:MAG: hypothetical protein Q9201_004638 [Fulgogasparrea decipioides]